ncbi:MAG: hypothetical protein WBW05_26670, partial [Candidatus Acidiferrum sp.]
MTFISAFRADKGIVLGADSQETLGDWKMVVDKLDPRRSGKYDLAMGGAGLGHLVDSLFDHILEWAEEIDTISQREIIRFLRTKVRDFYAVEVAAYPSKQNKLISVVLCMKHVSHPDLFLFQIRGTTVVPVGPFALVSLDTPIIQHFVRRLYRKNLPISQCVLLTIYLFSIVGSISTCVGGDTCIVIAGPNGIRVHEALYVDKIQRNMDMFTKLIDKLVLSCPDTSLTHANFESVINEFTGMAINLRNNYLYEFGQLAVKNALTNPRYNGDPYPLVPAGTVIEYHEVSRQIKEDGSSTVSEEHSSAADIPN